MLKGLATVLIVGLNAFFVAAEFALVRVRETQLRPLEERGSRRARLARYIVRNLDRYLSTVQLGITLCGLGVGALVEPLFSELLHPVYGAVGLQSPEVRRTISFLVGFLINTFVLIAVGELAPKSIALRKAVPISLVVAHPLWLIYWTCFPLIWSLNRTSGWVLRRLGLGDPAMAEAHHSEDELRLMITSAERSRSEPGSTPALGRDLVLNALDLRSRRAREVMQPRPEIVVFDTEDTIEACVKVAEETRYSRFPLCEGGNPDRMLGVVHTKDLYAQRHRTGTAAQLRPWARALIYIPETARLERVLHFLLDRRLHMAVVVDEYGGTVGLVTLENILEELVGEIQDEFDQEKPLKTRVDEHTWEVAGNLPLHELSELVGEPLQGVGVSSVGGWLTQRLGGFPGEGDTVPVGGYVLRVEEALGPRVARVRVVRAGPAAGDADRHTPTGPGSSEKDS
ncbi:MAG: HlyC/CorC family transporter [Verrucomicrobiae bacterium]|nr:HlyC/CorC family transporter [Verrucomicrobiae bacterium]